MKDGIQKINMTERNQLFSTHMRRVHTNASVFAAEHPVGNTRASNVLALVVGQRLVKLDICSDPISNIVSIASTTVDWYERQRSVKDQQTAFTLTE